jgi:hypothetical protein
MRRSFAVGLPRRRSRNASLRVTPSVRQAGSAEPALGVPQASVRSRWRQSSEEITALGCLWTRLHCIVAPAATRSAVLLAPATGPEQKLERGPRRSLAWPVVYVLEVDRLGRRFHALVTGSAAGGWASGRWSAVSPTGGVGPTRSLGAGRTAGDHGPPRSYSSRRLSSWQLDATGLRLSVKRTRQGETRPCRRLRAEPVVIITTIPRRP